jgi:hypothetical protein
MSFDILEIKENPARKPMISARLSKMDFNWITRVESVFYESLKLKRIPKSMLTLGFLS